LGQLAAGGGDTVDHALDAVTRLPLVGVCADTAALLAAVPPPDTEATRAQVAAVRSTLDEARADQRLAHYARTKELASAALDAARASGYRPAIAEALVVLGKAQISLADRTSAATLREALHVAAAAG